MSYTNIAIMGTYVTYMVGHLFDDADLKAYSTERLKRFYDHTMEKGGFTEYNSPTYTIIAIDELSRMKEHIIEPNAKQMVDKLYYIGWETIPNITMCQLASGLVHTAVRTTPCFKIHFMT